MHTHMPKPSLVNSPVPNHVPSLLLTPLDLLVPLQRPRHALHWPPRTRPVTPSDAPERARRRHGHASARMRIVDSDHPQPSPLSYATTTTPPTSQTPPLVRRCPVDGDAVDAIRHGCQNARTMTSAMVPRFQRNPALRHRQSIANPTASSPVPRTHCIAVVTVNMPRTLGHHSPL
jgi:hypothetical protein